MGATLIAAVLSLILITQAHADPCKAIPDHGKAPSYLAAGASFSGPVVYVGDGDSLCVGVGPGRDEWVEVRIADYYAPELSSPEGPAAKRALERIAQGRRVTCVAQHQSYDRIVARCELKGRSLGDILRHEGGHEGGNGFPGASSAVSAPAGAMAASNLTEPIAPQSPTLKLAAAGLCATAALGALYLALKPRRPAPPALRRAGKPPTRPRRARRG